MEGIAVTAGPRCPVGQASFGAALGAALAALALVLAAGCQSALDIHAPPSFNLAGVWQLNAALSDAPPDPREIRRLEDRDVVRGRQRDAEASSAFVAEDFPVVRARRMTIEQDAHSMGIRYDDGPYRDVTWGTRERDHWRVDAGWREGALVILSRRDLIQGSETMRLEPGGRRLHVAVVVKTGGREVRTLRVFDRQGQPR